MAKSSVTRSGMGAPGKTSSQRKSEAQTVSRTGKGDLQTGVFGKTTTANPIGRRYGEPIGPSYKGTVPGGYGIVGLNDVRMLPTANAPKASPTVRPAAQVITNVVRERTTPTTTSRSTQPARMDVNRVTGKTTGFTSGTTTGTTTTKSGTAYKTSESAYERQQRMAREKMGVAGPSSGGMRSTGGGSSSNRSTGGSTAGRGGTGPAGMGYSGTGTGSKR
jgi:hypothetical protein